MLKNQWIDLDIDYFNHHKDPVRSLKRMLKGINPETPCSIVVQHHEVLQPLRRAVGENKLELPMEIFHVDEHHDFYYPHQWKTSPYPSINCGNYLFSVNVEWSTAINWIIPKHGGVMNDWPASKKWLQEREIWPTATRKWGWTPERIGLITFALSPDFISKQLAEKIPEIFKTIENKFHPVTVVRKREDRGNSSIYYCSSWRTKQRVA
jgi:hypothetical protein